MNAWEDSPKGIAPSFNYSNPDSSLKYRKRKREEERSSSNSSDSQSSNRDARYQTFFEDEAKVSTKLTQSREGSKLQSSIIGGLLWVVGEKAVFFDSLTSGGYVDACQIAAKIKTKSELDVQRYLHEIRKSIQETDRASNDSPSNLIEMPAAVEVSAEFQENLDDAADELLSHQERLDRHMERAQYGESWLLTQDSLPQFSTLVDESSHAPKRKKRGKPLDIYVPKLGELLPALRLLKLESWLELSECIFMNSGLPESEQNWRDFSEKYELPAMYRSAFSEFYRIALSITKQLVSAALFQAESRARATDFRTRTQEPLVRDCDVRTAAKVLGISVDPEHYWLSVPQRYHLQVYDAPSGVGAFREVRRAHTKTNFGDLLELEEVERRLSVRDDMDQEVRQSAPHNMSNSPDDIHSKNSDSVEDRDDEDSMDDEDEENEDELLEWAEQEQAANEADGIRSAAEESRISSLLTREAHSDSDSTSDSQTKTSRPPARDLTIRTARNSHID